MKRRDLVKNMLLGGMASLLPWGLGWPSATAAAELQCGQKNFWVFVCAKGGWDATSLCDPKGNIEYMSDSGKSKGPINLYSPSDILQYGNILFSPYRTPEGKTQLKDDPYNAFLLEYAQDLLVVNGIETGTNNHKLGMRSISCGSVGKELPALSALIAASQGAEQPLSFISNGYYDTTQGIVPRSRISASGNELIELVQPNRVFPSSDTNDTLYHDPEVMEIIRQAQKARLQRLIASSRLGVKRKAMDQLLDARASMKDLAAILEKLPKSLSKDNERMNMQSQIACAGFASGITTTANIVLGGFDTHSNHEKDHFEKCATFLKGVDFLMKESERQGVRGRLNVVLLSDFSRTPFYNKNNQGKDHWTGTSMMFMGPSFSGNKVIGATDKRFKSRPLDVDTMQPTDSEGGQVLKSYHIHQALRSVACVDEGLSEHYALEKDGFVMKFA